jgi:RHS repeat-associated protein
MKTKIVAALLILAGIASACPIKPVSIGKVYSGVLKPGCTITFSGADSYDLSGRTGGSTYDWKWWFDYQGSETNPNTHTSSPYITHTFTQTGTYTIAVKYFSNTGSSGNLYTFQVVISDLKRYYYLKDHLGSVRATVNDSGRVVAYNDYDPWGYQLDGRQGNLGSANEKYKFTSKERDVESGYDYFGARYYDSRIGRWLAVDPLAEMYPDVNPYHYVRNNPIKTVDVDGRGDPITLAAAGLTLGELTVLAASATAAVLIATHHEEAARCATQVKDWVNTNINEPVIGMIKEAGQSVINSLSKNEAPPANNGEAKQHGSTDHDAKVNEAVDKAKQDGHTDIRKNQAQVNANGEKVGNNRPDVQSTDKDGNRHNTEIDRSEKNGSKHEETIKKNDPSSTVHKVTIP